MKKIIYILTGIVFAGIMACEDIIDLDPISNVGTGNFYRTYEEVQTALTGSYNGLHEPLTTEWMLTELRTDNAKQGVPNSTTTANIELNQLDLYTLNPTHPKVYDYWLSVYKNIRSLNYVLQSLGVKYNDNELVFGTGSATMTQGQRDQLAGEALFLRGYHYFNLVRLYGGVFLLTEPADPEKAKQLERASEQAAYDLIITDLQGAIAKLPETPYALEPSGGRGKAGIWAARALLAKVYLTLGRKTEALLLLDDVAYNSGYGLASTFDEVFAIGNEMNREILFAVRYKAGGLGLGNPMANTFAPTSSGSAVINGDGNGQNYPTTALHDVFIAPAAGPADARRDVTIGVYGSKLYVKKFLSPVTVRYDAENDFPVLRFSDVLLMKAEAMGYDGPGGEAVGIINQVRQRAGATVYTSGDFNAGFYQYPVADDDPNAITSEEKFTEALLHERRLELAFENHRFFDLVRLGKALEAVNDYYAAEYTAHYSRIRPVITLEEMQASLVPARLRLPIPQREIDTNDERIIPQNEGYQ